jgi:hypothetical protein
MVTHRNIESHTLFTVRVQCFGLALSRIER